MKVFVNSAERIAGMAAQRYVRLLSEKPASTLGFATGSTPLGLYSELARLCAAGSLSFASCRSFNLDEYVGLGGSHEQSYRYFMNENLFKHIDINLDRTFVPAGLECSEAKAAEYDKAIDAAGGIELQLLGIGVNGHIGFNEPGTPFGSRTHIVRLTESTRRTNARFFASMDEVPTHAVTMGIRTVMNAKSIILMAIGASKSDVAARAINGPVTEEVPASVLQLHPDVEIYLDYEAAASL